MADNYLITGYWGEPHVTAENDRGINAAMFGTGRFVLPVGEQFRAEYIGNNTVRIFDGKLMDNGAAAGIPAGEYIDLLISNASQGMNRKDLIIFQYNQDSYTMVESGTFVVIRGEETSGTASDPALTQGDLLSGKATTDQMALWRVSVSGATISAPVKMFSVREPLNLVNGMAVEAFNMGGKKITNMATPTGNTDATTKGYVDGIIHKYRGSYEGNIDETNMNGLYWIAKANCTGTFPSNHTYYLMEATERIHKLFAYSDNGIAAIYERYYVNNRWYDWQKTDAINSVPTARKINGKALTSDITLSASDVGAATEEYAQQLANAKLDMVIGYTRSNTTSSQGSGSITLTTPLTGCTHIGIVPYYDINNVRNLPMWFGKIGDTGYLSGINSDGDSVQRLISATSTTSVTFGNGYKGSNSNDQCCIPRYIFGFKGVG